MEKTETINKTRITSDCEELIDAFTNYLVDNYNFVDCRNVLCRNLIISDNNIEPYHNNGEYNNKFHLPDEWNKAINYLTDIKFVEGQYFYLDDNFARINKIYENFILLKQYVNETNEWKEMCYDNNSFNKFNLVKIKNNDEIKNNILSILDNHCAFDDRYIIYQIHSKEELKLKSSEPSIFLYDADNDELKTKDGDKCIYSKGDIAYIEIDVEQANYIDIELDTIKSRLEKIENELKKNNQDQNPTFGPGEPSIDKKKPKPFYKNTEHTNLQYPYSKPSSYSFDHYTENDSSTDLNQ